MEKIIWSVELSPYYDDDTFNGTFDECVEYCRDMEYIIGKDCRLAKILVNEEGCFLETLEIYEGEEGEI